MSSLWSHSHETNREAAEQSSDVHSLEHPSNLISLLAAVGNDLPLVDSSNLKFDKKIGKGSSFEVRRATLSSSEDQISTSEHYVAVKLIIVAGKAPSQLRRQYDSVIRELRVLTHPSLRDHDNIIHLIGYGWTNDVYGMRPYLVVDYSIDGTLIQYLNRIKPRMKLDLAELRELALDVALGLKALHNSKIIHGDIKTQNILAYNASGQGPRRSLIAKLADFGSSIFELDESQLVTYGGTALYNAPEQEGRGRYKIEKAFKLEHFYAADVYSFGITLWEIMNHGRAYIEIDWRMSGESDTQFLDRVCIDEEDGLLRRAVEFCERLFEGTNQNSVKMAILQTFNLTLRDLASRRSDMLRIIEVLAQGTK